MQDTFSFPRFALYFRKVVLERPIQLAGTLALSFSAVPIIYFFLKTVADFDAAQLISFTIGLTGGVACWHRRCLVFLIMRHRDLLS